MNEIPRGFTIVVNPILRAKYLDVVYKISQVFESELLILDFFYTDE